MYELVLIFHLLGAVGMLGVITSSFMTYFRGSADSANKHLWFLHMSLLWQSVSGASLMIGQAGGMSTATYCVRGLIYFAVVGLTYAMLLQKTSYQRAYLPVLRVMIVAGGVFLMPIFL